LTVAGLSAKFAATPGQGKGMMQDKWLTDLSEKLRRAKTADEVTAVMDSLEDQYDAFSGPGQELIEQLMGAARRRLQALS
jgi:hypothetical protein